jgi:tetraacyldisaccharide 4'-kinase
VVSTLLQPLAWAYAAGSAARRRWTEPWRAGVPVVCVGNLVAGGAGKTPVVLSLAASLAARGERVHILSRGYGGALGGPVRVDATRHDARQVGDEPLLLAAAAPSWVARDRVAGAKAAIAAGARLLLLDDGLQNPSLAKDLSLCVVDGSYGFGNGRVLPAGPLREAPEQGLARADAIVLMGPDDAGIAARLAARPVLRAHLAAENAAEFAGRPVVAFAGIGRPEKFFRSVAAAGARLIGRHAFSDHHLYREDELAGLAAEAERADAVLVTTAKDAVRLPAAWRARIAVLRVAVAWENAQALDALLKRLTHA